MKCTLLLSVCLLALFVIDIDAWIFGSGSSGGRASKPKRFTADRNKSGLTKLYNSKVVKVESYKRPMKGVPFFKHTGVVATTKDGGRWLIHKGKGYGKSSSTVVENAKNMSNKWRKSGSARASGQTISDLMRAGKVNKKYSVLGTNCWSSTRGIMNKIKGSSRSFKGRRGGRRSRFGRRGRRHRRAC